MCVGIATNNRVDYYAIDGLLTATLHLVIRRLNVLLDFHLLDTHLNKYYRVRDPCLFRKFLCTRQLGRNFESISFMDVPRILNRVADQMANDVLEWHINHRV